MTNSKKEENQKALLLVDELELLNRYYQKLEACGYKVAFTHRGDFALEMMNARRYDAIVIGSQVGGPSIAQGQGAETTKSIALAQTMAERYPDVPMIIIESRRSIRSKGISRRRTRMKQSALGCIPDRFDQIKRALAKQLAARAKLTNPS